MVQDPNLVDWQTCDIDKVLTVKLGARENEPRGPRLFRQEGRINENIPGVAGKRERQIR
jgi:hypothetical protein